MNRRFFMKGAVAAMGVGGVSAGALSLSSLFSPDKDAYADMTRGRMVCAGTPLPRPIEMAHLIHSVRHLLDHHKLLTVSPDITNFYNDVVDQYIAQFGENNVLGEDGPYLEEINEAAEMLGDQACHVAQPPATGCIYFEAWKFFRHHDAMKIYPVNGTAQFHDLTPAQQYYVAGATIAYAGMLRNVFGSLMDRLYPGPQLNDIIAALQGQTETLHKALESPTACPGPSTPDPASSPRRMLA